MMLQMILLLQVEGGELNIEPQRMRHKKIVNKQCKLQTLWGAPPEVYTYPPEKTHFWPLEGGGRQCCKNRSKNAKFFIVKILEKYWGKKTQKIFFKSRNTKKPQKSLCTSPWFKQGKGLISVFGGHVVELDQRWLGDGGRGQAGKFLKSTINVKKRQ